MTEENIKRMWAIDQKAQLGDKLTQEEVDFFNAHFDMMLEEMDDNYQHWRFHTSKI